MSSSSHASAASADLAALDSDNKQTLVCHQESVTRSHSEPVTQSHSEPVTRSHSEPVTWSYEEDRSKFYAEMCKSQGKPRSKKILSEIQVDDESDDGQQRLPRQPVFCDSTDAESDDGQQRECKSQGKPTPKKIPWEIPVDDESDDGLQRRRGRPVFSRSRFVHRGLQLRQRRWARLVERQQRQQRWPGYVQSDDGQQRRRRQSVFCKTRNVESDDGQQSLQIRNVESDDGQQSLQSRNVESDDGQQSLPGQLVLGKNPRIWISGQEWINYMTEDPHFRLKASIFRVPMFLKDTKRKAYVPQTVSLGPFHHKSKELATMDDHKGRALRRMMIRSNIKMEKDPDDMDFAIDAMQMILGFEKDIRDVYGESIDCRGRTLARMLCLDGCCILEVLRTLGRNPNDQYDQLDRNDLIIGENKLVASNILKDIVMLENQIPWIVLLGLLKVEGTEEGQVEKVLLNLLLEGTSGLFKISCKDKDSLVNSMIGKEFDHVLGFLHEVIIYQSSLANQYQDEHPLSIKSCIDHCLLMLQDKDKALNDDFESIPTAVELKNVGIKFRPCEGGIKGISFDPKRAIIYLPVVSITFGAEVLFRNLIAFEICRPSEPNYVSSYVNLMDDLIDSREDVALLRSMGILTKLIGSDKEVADLFNGLCKDVGIASMANRFAPVKKRVNKHYRSQIRVQIAELVRDHFSSKWKTLATWAAILLLCLAIVQTIYTVKSVYQK